MSMAFNKAGAPIKKISGIQTLSTADGSLIIFRVANFRTYLRSSLGSPTKDDISPYDDTFKGRKGIIAFTVNWQGATGHIALWNGITYREPSYDNYSTYVNGSIKTSLGEFWEIA